MQNPFTRSRELPVAACGLLVSALGALVLVGWWTHSRGLVQIHPSSAPMQFNTALCMLFAGQATLAVAVRRHAVTSLFAGAVLLIGAASGLQYVLDTDFGIDQLLMDHYVTQGTSNPGRMAPNAALAFAMSGLGLLLVAAERPGKYRCTLAEILSSLTAGTALVGLIGYATGIVEAYGWGAMTRMAVHTASGFLVLGPAVFYAAWLADVRGDTGAPRWLVVPTAVAAVAMVVSLSQALANNEARRISQAVDFQTRYLTQVLRYHVEDRLLALERMAARWERDNGLSYAVWRADSTRYIADFEGYDILGRADHDGRVRWQVRDSVIPALPRTEALSQALGTAISEQTFSLGLVPGPAGERGGRGAGFLVIVPLHAHGAPDGFLFGLLNPLGVLPLLSETAGNYGFSMHGDAATIFDSGLPKTLVREWLRETDVNIRDMSWRLSVWPTLQEIESLRSPLRHVVLVGSVLLGALLLVAIHFSQMSVRRASKLQELNSELKRTQEELERLAMFDKLTGLGNRNLFAEQAAARLESASRTNLTFCLMILDLNGFKAVNDTLGHKAGDLVLQEIARRLRKIARKSDHVFRLGGDEFAILLQLGTDAAGAELMASRLQASIKRPVMLYDEPKRVGASIGIGIFPRHGRSVDELLRAADVAMYEAKKQNRGTAIASDLGATMTLRALNVSLDSAAE